LLKKEGKNTVHDEDCFPCLLIALLFYQPLFSLSGKGIEEKMRENSQGTRHEQPKIEQTWFDSHISWWLDLDFFLQKGIIQTLIQNLS